LTSNVKSKLSNVKSATSNAKSMHFTGRLAAALFLTVSVAAAPMARAQQANYPVPGANFGTTTTLRLPPMPVTAPITANGSVVEDVVVRVNDQLITRSEYERAQQQMLQEAQQQHATQAELEDRLHNLLRDMIDQQLLLSKGKELGITGDAETMRQLDEIRKQNHLDSMEALEKAAEQQGVSYEDFKQNIKNNVITQSVVRDEVGRHLNLTHAQEQEYYDAHKQEFQVPEQVHLSEILVPTPETATDAQVSASQAKADELAAKLKSGTNFAELARTSSGGPTASAGGDLGDFKRGALGDVLENATFGLPVGGVTAPIRTRQGFVILRVDAHQPAGTPPLSQVEQQVEEAIYVNALQPALRAYLSKARSQAYIQIKPGFVDAGAAHGETTPSFTAYAPPPVKKKTIKKQQAEDAKAAKAQADLAAARAKTAEKQAATAAAKSGTATPVSAPKKHTKVHKEKIRYGQAPENSLPTGTLQTAAAPEPNAPIAGQAAGVAMAPTESVTSITTGTGVAANTDPLAQVPVADHKTRFTDRQHEDVAKVDERKVAKTEVKATARPVTATPEETADEKQQAGPMGINGDTAKKKKPEHTKDEPKQRMQEKPKPVETTTQPADTVNPLLATPATGQPAAQTPPAAPTQTPPQPPQNPQ
jgi:peptidyl-prolyl cis-trans isomerase SurA